MTRLLILLSAVFLACDSADLVLAEALQVALDAPPSKPAIVCKDGAVARPLAAGMALAVACEPVDAGRKRR